MTLPALIPTLLEFERFPGRWPLGRREPALLYSQTPVVLLLAAGRPVEGLQSWDTMAQAQARQAARFFVRTALLRPGTDPYTILGLTRTAEAEAIRTHYRLMIRLTHPDFSGTGGEWPPDAATRINLANDMLSSPERRAALDSALDKVEVEALRMAKERQSSVAARLVAAPPRAATPTDTSHATRGGATSAWWLSPALKIAGLALGALAALAGFVLLNPAGEDRSLVAGDSSREATLAGTPAGAPAGPNISASRYRLVATEEWPEKAQRPGTPGVGSLHLKMDTGTQSQPTEPTLTTATPLARPALAPERIPVAKSASVRVALPSPLPKPDRMEQVTASPPPTTPEPVAMATPPPPSSPAPVSPAQAAPVAVAPSPHTAAALAPTPRPPKLAEVQPVLARVEQIAQRGLGVPLAMLIHPSTRNTPGTQKFIFDFQDTLAGYRIAGLNRTDMNPREIGDELDVDLRMHFNLEDSHGSSLARQVGLRARFGWIDDKVALLRMTLLAPGAGN